MPGPSPKGLLAPSFEVLINGSPLPVEAQAHVVEITVDTSVEAPGIFVIELTSSSAMKADAGWADNVDLFDLGHTVEIKLGFDKKPVSLFKGEITGLEPVYRADSLPRLIVRGFDRLHRLLRGRKSRTFVKQKDSEIASQIASDAGLTADVTDSQVTHDYVYQHNQSDLEFLLTRAARIQYEILVEDKKLLFRPVANAKSEALTLTFLDDLLEFRANMSSVRQVSEVIVRGWNVKDKKEIVGRSKIGDEVSTMGGEKSGGKLADGAFGETLTVISSEPVATQAEADQMAKATLNQVSLDFVTGEAVCLGRPDLLAGVVIKLDGLDKRFNGKYYVTGAVHRYTPERGYRTHFKVRRNAS